MTSKEIQKTHESTFESIRKTNQHGRDFWSARDLQNILGYSKWDKFLLVIEKAKQSCANSGHSVPDHFLHVEKMVVESIKLLERKQKKIPIVRKSNVE